MRDYFSWDMIPRDALLGGGTSAKPTPPTVTPPARMTDPDDPAAKEAKRRQIAQGLVGTGRMGTILTGPSGDTRAKAPRADVASADSYAGTAL